MVIGYICLDVVLPPTTKFCLHKALLCKRYLHVWWLPCTNHCLCTRQMYCLVQSLVQGIASFKALLRSRHCFVQGTTSFKALLRSRHCFVQGTASFKALPCSRHCLVQGTALLKALPRLRHSFVQGTASCKALPCAMRCHIGIIVKRWQGVYLGLQLCVSYLLLFVFYVFVCESLSSVCVHELRCKDTGENVITLIL